MYDYAIRFEEDGTAPGVAVFCRDLPELNSFGDDRQHAISEAVDAIESALSIYVDQRRTIPAATPAKDGEVSIHLPAVTVAKIALWNEMQARGMRKADLCRSLGVSQTTGDRLVDFLHTSKMEQLERALESLKLKVELKIVSKNATKLMIRKVNEPNATRFLVHRADMGLDQLGIPAGLVQDYSAISPKIATVDLDGNHEDFWWLSGSAERLISMGWDAFSLTKMQHDDLGPTHDEELPRSSTATY